MCMYGHSIRALLPVDFYHFENGNYVEDNELSTVSKLKKASSNSRFMKQFPVTVVSGIRRSTSKIRKFRIHLVLAFRSANIPEQTRGYLSSIPILLNSRLRDVIWSQKTWGIIIGVFFVLRRKQETFWKIIGICLVQQKVFREVGMFQFAAWNIKHKKAGIIINQSDTACVLRLSVCSNQVVSLCLCIVQRWSYTRFPLRSVPNVEISSYITFMLYCTYYISIQNVQCLVLTCVQMHSIVWDTRHTFHLVIKVV